VADATRWQSRADVELDELRLGKELGSGGQGRVFRVDGMPGVVVYKQYKLPDPDELALQALVDLPGQLSAHDRNLLSRQTAWPLARVMRGGTLVGFLMPEMPTKFRISDSAGRPRDRELQYLLFEPRHMWSGFVPDNVDVRTRLSIASQCARLIALLHSHSLILGDISPRNIMWAPGRPPEIYLIDCDGIRRRGWRAVLSQAETPDWSDPTLPDIGHGPGPDRDADRYKLALLVGRILCRQPYLRPADELSLPGGIPDLVAAEIRALWLRAARPHGRRPDARDWLTALNVSDWIPELAG
jgi:DNA-binding helix-hairpin-helix protein with protein kinase domain